MKQQPSPIVRTLLTAVVWFGLAGPHFACAQTAPTTPRRAPSTEQERADALRLVDLLETSPAAHDLGDSAENPPKTPADCDAAVSERVENEGRLRTE